MDATDQSAAAQRALELQRQQEKELRRQKSGETDVEDAHYDKPNAKDAGTNLPGTEQLDADVDDLVYESDRAVRDASGYEVTGRELDTSGISTDQLKNMKDHEMPLAMDREQFDRFKTDLDDTLRRSGLHDADVRLQGSTAHYFSGNPDKAFPQSADEASRDGPEAAERYHNLGYDVDGPKPGRHFFDSRFALTRDEVYKSDYDIQISSDSLETSMQDDAMAKKSDHGGGWTDRSVRNAYPDLAEFSTRWGNELGREVNFQGFDSSGPSAESTAFKGSDWTLRHPDPIVEDKRS